MEEPQLKEFEDETKKETRIPQLNTVIFILVIEL